MASKHASELSRLHRWSPDEKQNADQHIKHRKSIRPKWKKSDIRIESVKFATKVHAYMHVHTSKVNLKFTCMCFKVNIGLVV